MKAVGITAEYNPFHFGHARQLRQALERSGAEAAVVCLSGDFVQRGECALLSKAARAEAAVRCGASLVLELPLPWCMASAEGFARGGVSLLAATGVVDSLSFGAECDDPAALRELAASLDSPELGEHLRGELQSGCSFAAARERAVGALIGAERAVLLREPNNILAVEYLRAASRCPEIKNVYAVPRRGSVHDGTGSASQLRERIAAGGSVEKLMPEASFAVLQRELAAGRSPVTMPQLEQALLSRLRLCTREDFLRCPDVSEGLENTLYSAAQEAPDWESLLTGCKSRRYALARLRRVLLSAALGVERGMNAPPPPYLRVLAADEKGTALLHEMRERAALPVIVKSVGGRELPGEAGRVFALTAAARDLYALGFPSPQERQGGADWRLTPYIMKERRE